MHAGDASNQDLAWEMLSRRRLRVKFIAESLIGSRTGAYACILCANEVLSVGIVGQP